MRNTQKDAVMMAEKRARMIKVGFKLFSERAIEPVTMQQIADESGIGIATVYRYFPTKLDFVIAVAVQSWVDFLDFVKAEDEKKDVKNMTAAQHFAHYLNYYIILYRDFRPVLRFNYDFNLYAENSGATAEQLKEFTGIVGKFAAFFNAVYEKGKADGRLKTDMSSDEIFASSAHIMLAAATRFAAGLMFRPNKDKDDESELLLLCDMIINRFTVNDFAKGKV